jgi:hypothetical protein
LQRLPQAFNIFSAIVPDIHVVIINNCGEDHADYLHLLEDDKMHLFHTNNQCHPTTNKGWKELKDVKDYLQHYNVPDDDFIIKLTGRYEILESSLFLQALRDRWTRSTECMIRLGDHENYGYSDVADITTGDDIDCHSGLVGFSCKHFKNMPLPCEEYQAVEWILAETSIGIPAEKKIIVHDLGLNIFW